MLSVQTAPFILCHSDVPIPLEVQGGQDWQNFIPAATWGYWILFGGNTVQAGEKITFRIYGNEIPVLIVPTTTPIPDSGLLVEENPPAVNIDTWLNTVFIPTVSQNYAIGQCTFVAPGGGILFINAPYETHLEVSTDITGATAAIVGTGHPEIYPPNYHILCDVYVTTQNTAETKIAQLRAVPEKNAPYKTRYNLQKIVGGYAKRVLPTFNQTSITPADGTMIGVRCVISEGWGSPVQYKGKQDVTPFMVLKGGVPYQYFPDAGLAYPFTAANHWLTWKPRTLTASRTQQEYLYFLPIYSILLPAPTLTCKLSGTIYYKDGTQQDLDYQTGIILDRYREYIFPVGYIPLNIGLFNSLNPVEGWTVFLSADISPTVTVILTPEQRYNLTDCAKERELFFLFGNSLNGFDTLRTTTNATTSLKIEREQWKSIANWDYSPEEGEIKSRTTDAAKRIKASTGLVSLEFIQYLHEFLISDEIYLIEDGKYLPVAIIPNTVELYRNNAHLYELEIQVEFLFSAAAYANKSLSHNQ